MKRTRGREGKKRRGKKKGNKEGRKQGMKEGGKEERGREWCAGRLRNPV